jgi:transcriptional regulator with XRE-family HTH domain
MSILGSNIKKLRSLHKLSQQEFGDLFELSRGSVGSYEEGRADPKIDSLVKIAAYFKVNIHDLLTRDMKFSEKENLEEVPIKTENTPLHSPKYLEQRVADLESRLQELEKYLKNL